MAKIRTKLNAKEHAVTLMRDSKTVQMRTTFFL